MHVLLKEPLENLTLIKCLDWQRSLHEDLLRPASELLVDASGRGTKYPFQNPWSLPMSVQVASMCGFP